MKTKINLYQNSKYFNNEFAIYWNIGYCNNIFEKKKLCNFFGFKFGLVWQ